MGITVGFGADEGEVKIRNLNEVTECGCRQSILLVTCRDSKVAEVDLIRIRFPTEDILDVVCLDTIGLEDAAGTHPEGMG